MLRWLYNVFSYGSVRRDPFDNTLHFTVHKMSNNFLVNVKNKMPTIIVLCDPSVVPLVQSMIDFNAFESSNDESKRRAIVVASMDFKEFSPEMLHVDREYFKDSVEYIMAGTDQVLMKSGDAEVEMSEFRYMLCDVPFNVQSVLTMKHFLEYVEYTYNRRKINSPLQDMKVIAIRLDLDKFTNTRYKQMMEEDLVTRYDAECVVATTTTIHDTDIENSFDSLSDDLMGHMLDFLPVKDLLAFSQTDTRCMTIADEMPWRRCYRGLTGCDTLLPNHSSFLHGCHELMMRKRLAIGNWKPNLKVSFCFTVEYPTPLLVTHLLQSKHVYRDLKVPLEEFQSPAVCF